MKIKNTAKNEGDDSSQWSHWEGDGTSLWSVNTSNSKSKENINAYL